MTDALVPGESRELRLEAWLTAYGDAVLRMCFIYLADRQLAEDALQDTFLKAWRRMDSCEARSGASAKTWIMRIAINTCKDYRRSAWFRHVDMEKAIEDIPLAAPRCWKAAGRTQATGTGKSSGPASRARMT